jgi:hypothetical protein
MDSLMHSINSATNSMTLDALSINDNIITQMMIMIVMMKEWMKFDTDADADDHNGWIIDELNEWMHAW